MLKIDLNCDMGEGMPNDAQLMPYISSANIACTYHAGDIETMKRTAALALEHKVEIGAHPSFPDRKNFGRTEMDWNANMIYEIISRQLGLLDEVVRSLGATIHHVKPHGALYNMAARDTMLSETIVRAMADFDSSLWLYGLAGSELIKAAKAKGISCLNEVFADRTYQPDGSLTSRKQPNALITETEKAIAQVVQMIESNTVTTLNKTVIPVQADTICIHGDGEHAVEFAKALHEKLGSRGVQIGSPKNLPHQ